MEWTPTIADGQEANDHEDHYAVVLYKQTLRWKSHKFQWMRWAVFKNQTIWLATADTVQGAIDAAEKESVEPQFFSYRPCHHAANVRRQEQRRLIDAELKKKAKAEMVRKAWRKPLYPF